MITTNSVNYNKLHQFFQENVGTPKEYTKIQKKKNGLKGSHTITVWKVCSYNTAPIHALRYRIVNSSNKLIFGRHIDVISG